MAGVALFVALLVVGFVLIRKSHSGSDKVYPPRPRDDQDPRK